MASTREAGDDHPVLFSCGILCTEQDHPSFQELLINPLQISAALGDRDIILRPIHASRGGIAKLGGHDVRINRVSPPM